MVTIKDGCGCDPCGCDWKQKLKEAYSRAIQSVNKIGDETGRVYFPDGTGFVKMPLPTKEQIDSIAEIDGIKASVDELNKTVPALETQVTGVTGSLVSDVEVLNGTTAGKFKVRIKREKAALIDSNDYDLSKVNSIELIQGSGPAMVKAQLTLSDGTVLRSDDFLFTSESIGTDVYISSFTFKNGNIDGTISADIGLNNGTTLEANNFVVPTDPSVVSTITDLQTRTEALEQNVIDINNKADLDNVNQVIVAKQIDLKSTVRIGETNKFGIIANTSDNPFNVTKEVEAFGQLVDQPIGSIAMLDANGNPMNFTAGGGGEVWEEVDLSNFPADWVNGERFKASFKIETTLTNTVSNWTTSISSNSINFINTTKTTPFIEFTIPITTNSQNSIVEINYTSGTLNLAWVNAINTANNFNANNIIQIVAIAFNGTGYKVGSLMINRTNISTYIDKMYRLKQ